MKKLVIFCCLCLLSVSLSGCSLFFAGFSLSGKEELVFSCDENLQTAALQKEEITTAAATETTILTEDHLVQNPSAQDVPSDVVQTGDSKSSSTSNDVLETQGLVDLNTATLEELMTLKGIGETRAKAILEYREKHGPFTKKEDIMQIPGIKEGIYKKLQNQIAVR